MYDDMFIQTQNRLTCPSFLKVTKVSGMSFVMSYADSKLLFQKYCLLPACHCSAWL